jgi:hypothetical protein
LVAIAIPRFGQTTESFGSVLLPAVPTPSAYEITHSPKPVFGGWLFAAAPELAGLIRCRQSFNFKPALQPAWEAK